MEKSDTVLASLNISRELNNLVSDWTAIIDRARKQNDLKALCVLWDMLDEQYTKINTARTALLKVFDNLNETILPEAFETAGIDKIAIPELARSFYPLTKYSASIGKDQNDTAMDWLRDNGLEALITETVHRGTLAATLHARLIEEGKDPPECMTLTKYKIISSSKYKPKGK